MITISYKWKYLVRLDINSKESNQRKVLWDFIKEKWIELIDEDLPLLDLYAKTLRLNWYNVERF